MYPAHIRIDSQGETVVQTVSEHCRATAAYAGESLRPANLYYSGFLAGLVHDVGKARDEFLQYIEKASKSEKVIRGSVIHTFQGCKYLLNEFHSDSRSLDYRDITSELIAYAAGAHHGLFDCCGYDNRVHGLRYRADAENIGYEESKKYLLTMAGGEQALEELFSKAEKECLQSFKKIQQMRTINAENRKKRGDDKKEVSSRAAKELSFYIGMEARLLLSSVIEGDRRDTASFMDGIRYPVYKKHGEDLKSFWSGYLEKVEERLREFPKNSPIQKARGQISDLCGEFASKESGVYQLNVPTGGGKTLASLRYALAHASKHNKRRIIFTAPLLSIIDQNAQIIREFLGDDTIVLEHHSDLGGTVLKASSGNEKSNARSEIHTREDRADNGFSGEEMSLSRRELLTESWNSPIIITSMVQLLQTLFSGKTSCIRRMQALCGSVVVIDEVQTVPGNMLSLFNLAVNYLSKICDVTFLLCSATQPYFSGVDYPLLKEPEDVVPYCEDLWKPFQRTIIQDIPGKKLEEIPDFIIEIAEDTNSLLVICNKKQEAEYLFKKVKETSESCFHLSASMCMAHRRIVLEKLIEALDKSKNGGSRVICISTQVIEAGIDISFEQVIRLAAGMDSVVQAAGRCNRNGEMQGGAPVYILDCVDEKLSNLEEISRGKDATEALLVSFHTNPEQFRYDLSSEESIRGYYRRLYDSMPVGYQDFIPKAKKGAYKHISLLSLLSDNSSYADSDNADFGHFMLNQAFAEAGRLFQVFDDASLDVVVPFDEGNNLIQELEKKSGPIPNSWLFDWIRRARPFTVSLYSYQIDALQRNGGIHETEGILILHSNHYDSETGVLIHSTQGDDFFL